RLRARTSTGSWSQQNSSCICSHANTTICGLKRSADRETEHRTSLPIGIKIADLRYRVEERRLIGEETPVRHDRGLNVFLDDPGVVSPVNPERGIDYRHQDL